MNDGSLSSTYRPYSAPLPLRKSTQVTTYPKEPKLLPSTPKQPKRLSQSDSHPSRKSPITTSASSIPLINLIYPSNPPHSPWSRCSNLEIPRNIKPQIALSTSTPIPSAICNRKSPSPPLPLFATPRHPPQLFTATTQNSISTILTPPRQHLLPDPLRSNLVPQLPHLGLQRTILRR